ncbi:hypothetical protein H0E87_007149 [Populus deltoides]|uniref:Uncharacterized protein n=1 Tax=Populus deltoides TaxID=3696 RepID=A0A8T2ZA11_POPDE|nr:hypothetical protein H0E87_007149 [Populus deltoides]
MAKGVGGGDCWGERVSNAADDSFVSGRNDSNRFQRKNKIYKRWHSKCEQSVRRKKNRHMRRTAANATNGWLDVPHQKDGRRTASKISKAGHLDIPRSVAQISPVR